MCPTAGKYAPMTLRVLVVKSYTPVADVAACSKVAGCLCASASVALIGASYCSGRMNNDYVQFAFAL